jgi:hypothetical protein
MANGHVIYISRLNLWIHKTTKVPYCYHKNLSPSISYILVFQTKYYTVLYVRQVLAISFCHSHLQFRPVFKTSIQDTVEQDS